MRWLDSVARKKPRGRKLPSPRSARFRPDFEQLETRLVPATFSVVNTTDSGDGSLRWAIEQANAAPGADIVVFNLVNDGLNTFEDVDALLPGGDAAPDVFVIRPLTPLPTLTDDDTTIDGRTQTATNGDTNPFGPEVVLDGSLAGAGADGISINNADRNQLFNLTIQNFSRNGVRIVGNNNLIAGSYLGTNATGTATAGNQVGVGVIGGTGNIIGTNGDGTNDAAERNVISGNTSIGIEITTAGTTGTIVAGNYIGTDAAGTSGLGLQAGISVENGTANTRIGTNADGTSDVTERNVISGNLSFGVQLNGSSSNVLAGNYIGVGADGITGVANTGGARGGVGVDIGGNASSNTIGGTTAAVRNVISGNSSSGIEIRGTGTGNVVQGNYIGTQADGLTALANSRGIHAGALNTTIGGTAAGAGNVLSGNTAHGIFIDDIGAVIQGNLIGLGSDGNTAVGNGLYGIYLAGLTVGDLTIGGTTAAARNVISANRDGIRLGTNSAVGNIVIQGNYVGTDSTGTLDRGNTLHGIVAVATGAAVTIGGLTATAGTGAGNVISGNGGSGVVLVSDGIVVQGNLIGTRVGGTVALGNDDHGIWISGAANSTIGGTDSQARNILSGNGGTGVAMVGSTATNNVVQGNYIGTDITGTLDVGNSSHGIHIRDSASGNTIGGTAAGARNIVSGNNEGGIAIETENNVVQGNYIGLNAAGTAPIQNTGSDSFPGDPHPNSIGVFGYGIVVTAANNTIGGSTATPGTGAGNVIAGNGASNKGVGVWVRNAASSGTHIEGNVIGLNAAGTATMGSQYRGVLLSEGATNITIGGTAAGVRNVISGAIFTNVEIQGSTTAANMVQGNYIGTNLAGTASISGSNNGIHIYDSDDNLIGGTTAAARNIISGNSGDGVEITNAVGNLVQGNYIGTDVTGTIAVINGSSGVVLVNAFNTLVGGTVAGAGNVISGGAGSAGLGYGVSIANTSFLNTVQGNYIGTDATGVFDLGNKVGVYFSQGLNNTIGGTTDEARNIISGNDVHGLQLTNSVSDNNRIQGNWIGLNVAGIALPNGDGLSLESGASGNLIGTLGYAGEVQSQLPRSYWRLDETAGATTAVNRGSHGTALDGTYVGSVALGQAGALAGDNNTAARFGDTTGDYVIDTSFGLTSAQFTFETWVRSSSSATQQTIVSYAVAGSANEFALISNNHQLGIYLNSNSDTIDGTTSVNTGVDVLDGSWHHVVVTWLASTGALNLYKDGAIVYTGTLQAGNQLSGSAGSFVLGQDQDSVGGGFDSTQRLIGELDEVAFAFGRLQADEVADLYAAGIHTGGQNIISGNAGTSIIFTGTTGTHNTVNNTVASNIIGQNAAGVAIPNGQDALVVGSDATLNGTGTIPSGVINAGTVAPGNSPGIIVIDGDYDQTTAGTLAVEIAGTEPGSLTPPPAPQFDQLIVNGAVTLDGALTVSFLSGFTPAVGNSFQIITNDGTDAVTGTFTGLAEGATFAVDSTTFQITYFGGTGNDVVLIAINPNGTLVTNANDSGAGSLRQAILNANANPGSDTISFSIPGMGSHTISLTSALPVITDAVLIDGYTQLGASANTLTVGNDAVLLIELDGTLAGANANGLSITSSGNTIRGLVINRFSGFGIDIQGVAATGNSITGNFIGTDVAGSADLGNALSGVYVHASATGNTIGGASPAARNVISGNNEGGVAIETENNVVQGNYIGMAANGVTGTPNVASDISRGFGIQVTAANNLIGGSTTTPGTGAGNIISTNGAGGPDASSAGVWVSGAASAGTRIEGNIIGADSNGAQPGGFQRYGVWLTDGATNITIGGTVAGVRNLISGAGTANIFVEGPTTGGNTVQGNWIGTNLAGNASIDNTNYGIHLFESNGNLIGGTTVAARNLISGLGDAGIRLTTAYDNVIQGNWIGIDATGTSAVANLQAGIVVINSVRTLIGGTASGAGNVISGGATGNPLGGGIGVHLAGTAFDNTVQGNFIGTDPTGVFDLGNKIGIQVRQGFTSLIGGTTDAARNIISGNDDFGILIIHVPNRANRIQGNWVGVNANGTALPNGVGIQLQDGPDANIIGVRGYEGEILSQLPTLYWRFDEIPGATTAVNHGRLGSNGDGTYQGSVALGQPGALTGSTNTAARFGDTTTDHISDSLFFVAGTALSFEAWVRSSSTAAQQTIVSYAVESRANEFALMSVNDELAIFLKGNTDTIDGITAVNTGVDVLDGQWHHIAVTWNTSAGSLILYKDGVAAYSGTLQVGATVETGGSLVLGQEQDSLGGGFDVNQRFIGDMDEVAFYGGFVPDHEVAAHYAAGRSAGGQNVIAGNAGDAIVITGATTDTVVASNIIGRNAAGVDVPNGQDAFSVGSGATLNGSGTITTDVVNSGTVAPGFSPGIIVIDGDYDQTTTGTLAIEIAGTEPGSVVPPPDPEFDRLIVNGAVTLDGALTVTFLSGFTPAIGNTFQIITNDGTDAVTGTFTGLAEGATFVVGSTTFQINYVGGTGNDVVLSVIDPNGTLVTNTNDSGAGSLRQAILNANANPGIDTISFSIPGTGLHTIALTSALPFINETVILDATTQPGWTGTPLIQLDGTNAGNVHGLLINTPASNSTIRGLVISNFGPAGAGIAVYSDGNRIQGNWIGTNATGTAAGTQQMNWGLLIASSNNIIGTGGDGVNDALEGNVISGNFYGVVVADLGPNPSGNIVAGNKVGTNAAGSAAVANAEMGIYLLDTTVTGTRIGTNADGISDALERNIVAGNGNHNLYLNGSGHVIAGNYIGTDITGTTALGGAGIMLYDGTTGVRIGTNADGIRDDIERNIISGNLAYGVRLFGSGTTGNTIAGNYIGVEPDGMTALGNAGGFSGGVGVYVDGGASGNTIGGSAPGAGNVISGNTSDGIFITGATTTGNVIQSNIIGLNVLGTAALNNGGDGIHLSSAGANTIGGVTPASRNVISGNGTAGIHVDGTSGTLIVGNYIGTNPAGTAALGNIGSGLVISSGASGNTVGGTVAGTGNVISGNLQDGIRIQDSSTNNNLVAGNIIGLNAVGTAALNNGGDGIEVNGAVNNLIGGVSPAARNIISGNFESGIEFFGGTATGNKVQGNYIGTDITGLVALGNAAILTQSAAGVSLVAGAHHNIVGVDGDGSNDALEGNLISGNRRHALRIQAPNNVVAGNNIGVNATGIAALANTGIAISILSTSGTRIGTNGDGVSDELEGNVISGNGDVGVDIFDSLGLGLAHDNIVAGNFIGTDRIGPPNSIVSIAGQPINEQEFLNLGNSGPGITLRNAQNNTIGGDLPLQTNIIAYNAVGGVGIFESVAGVASSGNSVRGNAIFSNAGLGIDLNADGITANDANDADGGSNGLQNHPVLTLVETLGATTRVVVELASAASQTFTIDFYASTTPERQGKWHFGAITLTTGPDGRASADVVLPATTQVGLFVTATATDATGNTSEFSAGQLVTPPPDSGEVNDTRATATNLGTLATPGTLNRAATIHHAQDVDFYQVTLTQSSFLHVETLASRAGSPLDPVLALLDSSGAVIAENDDLADRDAIIDREVVAGTYFIRVSNFGGTIGHYQLQIATQFGGPEILRAVPSNTLAAAPTQIVLFLDNNDLNPATITPAAFRIERFRTAGAADRDTTFNPNISIGSYNAASDTLTLNVSFTTGDASLDGRFELTAFDTITNLTGAALDGDRNGSAGGNFVANFALDTTPPTGTQPELAGVAGTDATGTRYRFRGTVSDAFPAAAGEPIRVELDVDGAGFDDGFVIVSSLAAGNTPYEIAATTGIAANSGNVPVRLRFVDARGNTSAPAAVVVDTDLPVVTGVQVAGQTIQVSFNQPGLQNVASAASYQVTGRVIAGVSYDAGTRTTTLSFVGDLPEGTYTLTVFSGATGINDGTFNLDGNGDGLAGGDFVTTVVVDRTVAVVTDARVDATDDNTTGGVDDNTTTNPKPTLVVAAADIFPAPSAGVLTVRLDSDNDGDFDDGTTTIVVNAGQVVDIPIQPNRPLAEGTTQVGIEVVDAAGNRTTTTLEVTTDYNPPSLLRSSTAENTVNGLGQPAGMLFTLDFDEALEASSAANLVSYRLVDSGGDRDFTDFNQRDRSFAIASVTYSLTATGSRVVVEANLLDNGLGDEDYELTVLAAGIADVAGNLLRGGDQRLSFQFETTAPRVADVLLDSVFVDQAPDRVFVYFRNDDLDRTTAENAGNYLLQELTGLGGAVVAALPVQAHYDIEGDRVVLSGFGALTAGRFYRLTVSDGVRNLTGVALDGDANGLPGGVYVEEFQIAAPGAVRAVDSNVLDGNARNLAEGALEILAQQERAQKVLTERTFAEELLKQVRIVVESFTGTSADLAEAVNQRINTFFTVERRATFATLDFRPGEFVVVWGHNTRFLVSDPQDDPTAPDANRQRIGFGRDFAEVKQVAGGVLVGEANDLSLAILPVDFRGDFIATEEATVNGVSQLPNLNYRLELEGLAATNQAGLVAFGDGGQVGTQTFVDAPRPINERTVNLGAVLIGFDPNIFHVNQELVLREAQAIFDRLGQLPDNLLILWVDPVDLIVRDPARRQIGHAQGNTVNQIPGAYFSGDNLTELLVIPNALAGQYDLALFGVGTDYRGTANFFSKGQVTSVPFQGRLLAENLQNDAQSVVAVLDFGEAKSDSRLARPDLPPESPAFRNITRSSRGLDTASFILPSAQHHLESLSSSGSGSGAPSGLLTASFAPGNSGESSQAAPGAISAANPAPPAAPPPEGGDGAQTAQTILAAVGQVLGQVVQNAAQMLPGLNSMAATFLGWLNRPTGRAEIGPRDAVAPPVVVPPETAPAGEGDNTDAPHAEGSRLSPLAGASSIQALDAVFSYQAEQSLDAADYLCADEPVSANALALALAVPTLAAALEPQRDERSRWQAGLGRQEVRG